ncbi:DEAD/DEAH box helicase [Streptomyces echinatus]|uniref:DEAD/DEAH box helicase n=1 Tax=Streptomyces echinatus TaxID=67293 RepID=UPI003CD05636
MATPGRPQDLIERGGPSWTGPGRRHTVLDEADQMADMGFMPQVTALLDQVPAGGQRLLFSAHAWTATSTSWYALPSDAPRWCSSVDPSAGAVTTMEHHLLHVRSTPTRTPPRPRSPPATDARSHVPGHQARGGTGSRSTCCPYGVRASGLHGGKSQSQRATGRSCPVQGRPRHGSGGNRPSRRPQGLPSTAAAVPHAPRVRHRRPPRAARTSGARWTV